MLFANCTVFRTQPVGAFILLPMFLWASSGSWAASGNECTGPKADRDPELCGVNEPNSETSDCQIEFSVAFANDEEYGVRSDTGAPYPDPDDRRDKSGGHTGSGPGFKFDSNGTGKLQTDRDTRYANVDTDSLGSNPSGVDLIFHLNSGGLDLCSLDSNDPGPPATVPMILNFIDQESGNLWRLLYGCLKHSGEPIAGTEAVSQPATVERLSGSSGGWSPDDEWLISGTSACLQAELEYATGQDFLHSDSEGVRFQMTITAQ